MSNNTVLNITSSIIRSIFISWYINTIMNPTAPAPAPPVKPLKEANASQYYKAQHSDSTIPEPVVIKPANKKFLRFAAIAMSVGVVSAIVAVITNVAGFIFELISTLSLITAFVFFVRWSLKTIDKSIPNK
jgi:hypothetical protein